MPLQAPRPMLGGRRRGADYCRSRRSQSRSKLRSLFEKTDGAAAIPAIWTAAPVWTIWYENRLACRTKSGCRRGVVDCGNLGSDRMVSRMELDKLALYAAGQSEITLEDAQAVIGDAAAVTWTMWFSQQPEGT